MITLIDNIQYSFIQNFYKLNVAQVQETHRRSLEECFGFDFPLKVKDKVVIDFGCGYGADTEQIARWGAQIAIGLEIREELVRENQEKINLSNCQFYTHLPTHYFQAADMIISVDAFEHFDEPDIILEHMFFALKSGGMAYINFRPTWYHPYGGHLFSVFPWAHLLLSERALVKWRNQYFHDGATCFTEVAGGLNKMKIQTFENIVRRSGFELEYLECTPLRNKPWLQKILGREFATGAVQARLRKP